MHKVIVMMLLTVVSSNAMAEWVEVSSSDDLGITVYADPSSIRKADNKLKMWFLSDYKKARGLRSARYMSVMSQIECDCMEDQVMELFTKGIWPKADQSRLALVLLIGSQSHLEAYMNTF